MSGRKNILENDEKEIIEASLNSRQGNDSYQEFDDDNYQDDEYDYGNDQDGEYEDEKSSPIYSFEIKEDFEELKAKLLRSMKNGLIRESALRYVDRDDRVDSSDNFLGVSSEEDYWCGSDQGTREYGDFIRIDKDEICVEQYETYSLGVDEYGNDRPDSRESVTIKSKESGGCIVSGNVIISLDHNIVSGVRDAITYIPDSLVAVYDDGHTEKLDDSKLLGDEKRKKNGLQDYKNIYSDYDKKIAFDMDRFLDVMDPNGHVIAGSVRSALYSSDADMGGSRRDVHANHHKLNYGRDDEIEYLDVWDGKYPEDCIHDVTEGGGSWTDWGWDTTIPEHWSRFNADEYFNMRLEGHPVSERMFDGYLKSENNDFEAFVKQVWKQFLQNSKKGMTKEESLDSVLHLINVKNRVRQNLNKNKEISSDIKSGVAQTKESGYKHISRTPKDEVKTPAWARKRARDGKGE